MFFPKQTFHYTSAYWQDKNTFNVDGGKTAFDSLKTKLPSYWNTSFSKICLGMKINSQISFIEITKSASSLYSLMADGQYRSTSLGRDKWKSVVGPDASLQVNCNMEGFNAACTRTGRSKARIGIVGNDENDCWSCNSRIGFGTGGEHDDSNTCGNDAMFSSLDNGDQHIKAMGYILVQ